MQYMYVLKSNARFKRMHWTYVHVLSYCVMKSQAELDVSPLMYVLSRICRLILKKCWEMEAESQHVGNVSTNVPYMLMFFVSYYHIILSG